MKYIMFRSDHPAPRLIPIIFPNFLVHDLVAQAMKPVLMKHNVMDARIVSAGDADGVRALASGKSETLRVTSQDVDTEVISSYDYFHGMIEDGEPE